MPRPPHVPDDESRRFVEVMVCAGIDQEQIAKVLQISEPTLRKHYPHEIAVGMSSANATVAARLFKMTETIPAAAMFWLKTRAGWRETNRVELDDISKLTDEELKARVIAIESGREKSV